MGKNLKGKECGKGICQRKDGLYFARFYAKNGARQNGYFKTLPEAKKWLADAKYEDTHNLIVTAPDMTVDKWFNYWIDNIICDLAPNTIRNYRERYEKNIQPLIGTMCIADVKPMHCKAVLNRMETEYAGSTIRQTYISMGTMFKSAVMNDIIAKHPMNGVRYTKPVRAVDDIKYLTVEEQEKFLEAAERSHNYRQYALLLETGLRTAELIGLTWDAIDWKKRTLTVNKSLEYRHSRRYWRAGPPKTKKSYRTIPLTERAYTILKSCYDEKDTRKESEMLSQIYYIQRDTEERVSNVVMMGTGEPMDNYDNVLRFLELITSEDGLNISQRNITISTCGIVPKIKELAQKHLQITLAMSLHSPNDEMRRGLMPIAMKYSIDELLDACHYYFKETNRRMTFEYSLVAGVNDQPVHAEELAGRLKGFPCHVNLIPVNPIKERDFKQSMPKSVMEFKKILEKNRVNVTIRREMGADINAACGQLRRKKLQSRL